MVKRCIKTSKMSINLLTVSPVCYLLMCYRYWIQNYILKSKLTFMSVVYFLCKIWNLIWISFLEISSWIIAVSNILTAFSRFSFFIAQRKPYLLLWNPLYGVRPIVFRDDFSTSGLQSRWIIAVNNNFISIQSV